MGKLWGPYWPQAELWHLCHPSGFPWLKAVWTGLTTAGDIPLINPLSQTTKTKCHKTNSERQINWVKVPDFRSKMTNQLTGKRWHWMWVSGCERNVIPSILHRSLTYHGWFDLAYENSWLMTSLVLDALSNLTADDIGHQAGKGLHDSTNAFSSCGVRSWKLHVSLSVGMKKAQMALTWLLSEDIFKQWG